ncbi:hypothetical protein AYL99_11772 [Fonsecaea erecta]|uniref:Uncharacterized protein n=1 Tax=Fonsecaea erecta TaxID=1367422 RepID=A0A178Z2L1_9EURO|nr:hypothetical protein AYL99_11772 [Fonsecaea erecta]OAP54012.1 hypothetical protein AYL99_11772 [Fonsecaea erecta]
MVMLTTTKVKLQETHDCEHGGADVKLQEVFYMVNVYAIGALGHYLQQGGRVACMNAAWNNAREHRDEWLSAAVVTDMDSGLGDMVDVKVQTISVVEVVGPTSLPTA